jgi:cystinosin
MEDTADRDYGAMKMAGAWLKAFSRSLGTTLATLPEGVRVALLISAVVLIGTILAFAWPTGRHLPQPYATLSAIFGWSYFCFWTMSFFPQVYSNFLNKSVVGLSFDFVGMNLLGFTSYALFNCSMFWNKGVRAEYKEFHSSEAPPVEASDVLFSVCGACMTLIMAVQCCVYERGGQVISRACSIFIAVGLCVGATYTLLVTVLHKSVGRPFTWLYLLYYFSFIKLCVTPLKYIPQVILNFNRKSTQGWNIFNVLLDLSGGTLSLAQILLIGAVSSDWTVVTGNLVRFGLALISLVFDVIFVVQHYVLYPGNKEVPAIELVHYEPVFESGDMSVPMMGDKRASTSSLLSEQKGLGLHVISPAQVVKAKLGGASPERAEKREDQLTLLQNCGMITSSSANI